MNDKHKRFMRELSALLQRYNADIRFNCDKGSDTYGLIGERIEVLIEDKVIAASEGYWLETGDLEI